MHVLICIEIQDGTGGVITRRPCSRMMNNFVWRCVARLQMDHLVCFLAGTLALGAETTTDPTRKERDMKTAKVLNCT